jgi:hypothetical protein
MNRQDAKTHWRTSTAADSWRLGGSTFRTQFAETAKAPTVSSTKVPVVLVYFAIFHSALARKNFGFVGSKSGAGRDLLRGKSWCSRWLRLRSEKAGASLFPIACKLVKNRLAASAGVRWTVHHWRSQWHTAVGACDRCWQYAGRHGHSVDSVLMIIYHKPRHTFKRKKGAKARFLCHGPEGNIWRR